MIISKSGGVIFENPEYDIGGNMAKKLVRRIALSLLMLVWGILAALRTLLYNKYPNCPENLLSVGLDRGYVREWLAFGGGAVYLIATIVYAVISVGGWLPEFAQAFGRFMIIAWIFTIALILLEEWRKGEFLSDSARLKLDNGNYFVPMPSYAQTRIILGGDEAEEIRVWLLRRMVLPVLVVIAVVVTTLGVTLVKLPHFVATIAVVLVQQYVWSKRWGFLSVGEFVENALEQMASRVETATQMAPTLALATQPEPAPQSAPSAQPARVVAKSTPPAKPAEVAPTPTAAPVVLPPATPASVKADAAKQEPPKSAPVTPPPAPAPIPTAASNDGKAAAQPAKVKSTPVTNTPAASAQPAAPATPAKPTFQEAIAAAEAEAAAERAKMAAQGNSKQKSQPVSAVVEEKLTDKPTNGKSTPHSATPTIAPVHVAEEVIPSIKDLEIKGTVAQAAAQPASTNGKGKGVDPMEMSGYDFLKFIADTAKNDRPRAEKAAWWVIDLLRDHNITDKKQLIDAGVFQGSAGRLVAQGDDDYVIEQFMSAVTFDSFWVAKKEGAVVSAPALGKLIDELKVKQPAN